MRSRRDFLALFEDITVNRPFINNFQSEDVGYSVSLSEISRVSDEIRFLLDKKIGRNFHYVGALVSDNLWLPCLLLGIWKSGKACACMGPQYSRDVNLNFINALQVSFIVTDSNETFMGNIDTVCQFTINTQQFFICKRQLESSPASVESDTDMCYGIMTSGSTGAPKIIQVPWSCILPNAVELIDLLSIKECDNIYLSSPYTFDPFFIELFMSMIAGCLLTIASNTLKISSTSLLEVLFKEKSSFESFHQYDSLSDKSETAFACQTDKILNSCVTTLQITPSVIKQWGNDAVRYILGKDSPLKVLLLGGEKFPLELMELKSKDNFTKVYNIYGITEVSCWAFLTEVNENEEEVSLGIPLHEIIYKTNEESELLIGSRSRKCIVDGERHTTLGDEILFRKTGDIVDIRNGKLYYVCRRNQVVKKFGMKINLCDIEKQFLDCNKQINECFCIFDEETVRLAVFYVNTSLRDDYCILTGEECGRLQGKGGSQRSIENPDYVIQVRAIPLNGNGKCDREGLLKLFKKIILKRKCTDFNIEECFHDVWTSIVGTTNFLHSGGDSVKALQIVTQLDECGIQVPKNFLTVLLKNGDYVVCLNVLLENSCRSDRKRVKMDSEKDKCELSVLWTFDMGKCIDAPVTVFTTSDSVDHVVVGSHSSMLSSLTIETGQEDWTINLGDRIESGMCVDSSATFGLVGCYDHYVYCISMAGGQVLWRYKTDGMIKSTPCLSSAEDSVYVASYDTHLYCLKCQDGSLLARVKLSEKGIFSSPLRSDEHGTLYVATLDGTCLSLNQRSNNVVWKHRLSSPVFASPGAASGGAAFSCVIFAEVTGRLHCFHAVSGDKLWSYESNGNIYCTPVFVSDHLVVFGCYDSHLYCLTLMSGTSPTLKWKTQVDSPVFAKPCVKRGGSDILVVATIKGWIHLCRVDSGLSVGRIKQSAEVFSSPQTSGDKVIVGCRDNKLYCIRVEEEHRQ